jgi:hypothetical protein
MAGVALEYSYSLCMTQEVDTVGPKVTGTMPIKPGIVNIPT